MNAFKSLKRNHQEKWEIPELFNELRDTKS